MTKRYYKDYLQIMREKQNKVLLIKKIKYINYIYLKKYSEWRNATNNNTIRARRNNKEYRMHVYKYKVNKSFMSANDSTCKGTAH